MTDSFHQAVNWLDICGRHGITLNPDKFVFGQDTVEFAGFEITPSSVRPCARYLDAIRNFPTPTNITDIRSWFGLINQVSYAFAASSRMQPFRQALKPGTAFIWNKEIDNLFNESKSIIINEIEEGVRISINRNQHVWPRTGRRLALDFGSSKSTVSANPRNPSAALQAGKPPLSAVVLPMQRKPGTPPSKARPLPLLMLSTKHGTLPSAART